MIMCLAVAQQADALWSGKGGRPTTMTQGVTVRSTVCRSFTTNLRSEDNPQTAVGVASGQLGRHGCEQ